MNIKERLFEDVCNFEKAIIKYWDKKNRSIISQRVQIAKLQNLLNELRFFDYSFFNEYENFEGERSYRFYCDDVIIGNEKFNSNYVTIVINYENEFIPEFYFSFGNVFEDVYCSLSYDEIGCFSNKDNSIKLI